MAGEEEDDGDDGDKKAKPQSELFQVITRVSTSFKSKLLAPPSGHNFSHKFGPFS